MIPPRAVQSSPTIARASKEQRDARRLGALLIVHLGAVRDVGHERLGKAGAPVPGPNLPTERSVPGAAR
jgi:hypothetical protein